MRVRENSDTLYNLSRPGNLVHIDYEDLTMLFSKLFDLYFSLRVRQHLNNTKNPTYFYSVHGIRFAERDVESLSRKEIQEWVDEIGLHSTSSATRAVDMLSAVIGWGIRRGYVDGTNPCKGVERFPRTERTRFLLPDEIRRFKESLSKEPQIYQDLFRLSLATGVRKANLCQMKWEHVDLEIGMWRIPKTKNGEEHIAPLNSIARKILAERPRESEYVFPGRYRGHIKELKRPWKRIVKRAGLEDVTIHDLRRTHGSCLAIQGESAYIIGKSLGHKDPRSTAIYARLNIDPVKRAIEEASQKFNW